MNFLDELYDDVTSLGFQRLNNIIKWLTELCSLVALIGSGAKSTFAKIVKVYLWIDVVFQGLQIAAWWVVVAVQLITGRMNWKDVKELYEKKALNTDFTL